LGIGVLELPIPTLFPANGSFKQPGKTFHGTRLRNQEVLAGPGK
jgi:hypothetical protein